jgi:hypothetical protein
MITKQKVQQMARRFFDEHYKKQIKPGSISQQKPKDYIVMSTFDEQIREAAKKYVDDAKNRFYINPDYPMEQSKKDFISGANHAKALLDKRVEGLVEALEHIANPIVDCHICFDGDVRVDRHYENLALDALKAWRKGE